MAEPVSYPCRSHLDRFHLLHDHSGNHSLPAVLRPQPMVMPRADSGEWLTGPDGIEQLRRRSPAVSRDSSFASQRAQSFGGTPEARPSPLRAGSFGNGLPPLPGAPCGMGEDA